MSSTFQFTSESIEYCSTNEQLNNMSPITDLALNLKSLKTTSTSTGTPTRRISWSDPFKNSRNASCIDELSPSTDSPMFFEIPKKEPKRLKRTVSRKLLSMHIEDDKENMPPKEAFLSKFLSSESDDINCSQDSGYSSTSAKKCGTFACGTSSHLKVRNSLFTNAASEEMEGIFPLDEDSNMEPEADSSMISLLTKPLCMDKHEKNINKVKSSTRRCLTMDMETSFDLSHLEVDISQKDCQITETIIHKNLTSTDLEPLRRLPFKRPDPSTMLEWNTKRRKSSPALSFPEIDLDKVDFVKQRSFSETAATIMQAVQKADLQPDLIGDYSRYYALPLIKGRHQDLKCISPDTLVSVLKGEYSEKIDSYTVIDCRYPYEFEGGHIQGAVNIFTKEDIIETFLKQTPETSKKNVIIFHCEFSSERAPNLCRFLRNTDRELNEISYPKLHHPEIYLLEGGYKAFFQNFQEFCEPQDYKPMNHKDHNSELRLYRSKSKSWGCDSKSRFKMKSSENMDV